MSDTLHARATDLEALKDAVILAACKWYSADIYVHPVLSRAEAVKVGVCDLIDAVQKYQNAKACMEGGMLSDTTQSAE